MFIVLSELSCCCCKSCLSLERTAAASGSGMCASFSSFALRTSAVQELASPSCPASTSFYANAAKTASLAYVRAPIPKRVEELVTEASEVRTPNGGGKRKARSSRFPPFPFLLCFDHALRSFVGTYILLLISSTFAYLSRHLSA